MNTLLLALAGKTYPIVVGNNFVYRKDTWAVLEPGTPIVVITQASIAELYLPVLRAALSDFELLPILIPEGEANKNLTTVTKIIEQLVQREIPRTSKLIAMGGGIVGDITGFVASIYQRGVAFIQIPTTLLAQVDASVGGKTGINFGAAKNILGTFYQPERVLIDAAFLSSLPMREYTAGLAEVMKYGLILDANLLQELLLQSAALKARDETVLIDLIYRCCALKVGIVAEDEQDHHRRMILNFGHTFAHALEAYYAYARFLHGEAVALGMLLALKLGAALGFSANQAVYPGVRNWLQVQGLPVDLPADVNALELINLMQLDKKKAGTNLRFIILEDIGRAKIVSSISALMLESVLKEPL